ncbi:DUF1802 family protein [Thalassoroseus pseudoceratinae]|uniref:DUF1802 family protein n=1 Tax=Thalassoroseus pseudoceratinae TaxID=2713176 RepID=UPI0014225D06|nr:DUF1802 family protein [Thalassoroseus pseudoceratinae]
MLAANRFAFKEWASVCIALAEGRQSVIFRKGGIHESQGEFTVDHPEFWLFPTKFHQDPTELSDEHGDLIPRSQSLTAPADTVHFQHYVVVTDIIRLQDESRLPYLTGLHVWSDQTLSQRFHYRHPGLFALLVSVFTLAEPIALPDSPHFAGCRSWVDLPEELPVAGLKPVLSAAESEKHWSELRVALTSSQIV